MSDFHCRYRFRYRFHFRFRFHGPGAGLGGWELELAWGCLRSPTGVWQLVGWFFFAAESVLVLDQRQRLQLPGYLDLRNQLIREVLLADSDVA